MIDTLGTDDIITEDLETLTDEEASRQIPDWPAEPAIMVQIYDGQVIAEWTVAEWLAELKGFEARGEATDWPTLEAAGFRRCDPIPEGFDVDEPISDEARRKAAEELASIRQEILDERGEGNACTKRGLEGLAIRSGATLARVRESINVPGVAALFVLCPSPAVLAEVEASVQTARPLGVEIIVQEMIPEKLVHMRLRGPRGFWECLQGFFGKRFYEVRHIELGE
jgi:hypothetical protein